MPIIFVMQGKCLFSDISRPAKLPFVIKISVLSIFEWPFYTDFTVCRQKSEKDNVLKL